MRPVAWLVVGGLVCGGLGFLLGRSTVPVEAPSATREQPTSKAASPSWPTVWPASAPRLALELETLLDPRPISASERVARDLRREAERIRGRYLRVRRSEVRSRIDLPALHLRRLRFRYLGDLISDRELSGFSMPGPTLKWSVKRAWRTPFGAYFHHGRVHELRCGRWAQREVSPWGSLTPAWR